MNQQQTGALTASCNGKDTTTNDTIFASLDASPFAVLPLELQLVIFYHSPTLATFNAILRTCRLWSLEAENEAIWQHFSRRDYPAFARYKPPTQSWKWMCHCGSNHTVGGYPRPRTGPSYVASIWIPPGTHSSYLGELSEAIPHGVGIWLRCLHDVSDTPDTEWVARTGQIRNGVLEGLGSIYYKKAEYSGSIKGDQPHGQGTLQWYDMRDVYTGEFRHGLRHGHGKYTFANGNTYVGQFIEGQIEGIGTFTFSQGTYHGDFVAGQQAGHGVLTWKNGNSFTGTFSHNTRTGYGVYTWSDGCVYKGEWLENNRVGQATSTYANGVSYSGGYHEDLRHGAGILQWPNGDRFEGKWRKGARWGKGCFICAATGLSTVQHWKEETGCQYSRCVPLKWPPTEHG